MKSWDIIIQYQSVLKEKKPYDYYEGIFQELVHFVNMVDVKIYFIVHMVMWSDMLKGHIFKETMKLRKHACMYFVTMYCTCSGI